MFLCRCLAICILLVFVNFKERLNKNIKNFKLKKAQRVKEGKITIENAFNEDHSRSEGNHE